MRIWSWHVHRDSNDICFSHFYRSHLGEVEHDVDEDERDSQHEDPKDQVESQEPKQARKLQATLEGCNPKLSLTVLLAHRGKV